MHKLIQPQIMFKRPSILIVLLFVGLVPVILHAQSEPETGGKELEFWTEGGHGTNGVEQHTGVWSAGFRYGWVLTEPHGPSFLNGRFEYALEASPAVLLFQRTSTAYGASLTPFALTWNFETRGRVVPYADLSGGVLLTNTQAPPGTTRLNFTSSGGIGVHVLTAGRWNWTADVRYVHISNSGITAFNPGYNTAQLRVGLGWFTHAER